MQTMQYIIKFEIRKLCHIHVVHLQLETTDTTLTTFFQSGKQRIPTNKDFLVYKISINVSQYSIGNVTFHVFFHSFFSDLHSGLFPNVGVIYSRISQGDALSLSTNMTDNWSWTFSQEIGQSNSCRLS